MNLSKLKLILLILNQVNGPAILSYQTMQIDLITNELIGHNIKKISQLIETNGNFFDEFNISEMFSLYMCLNHIITDLGVEEFETVIGEDIFSSGFGLLTELKSALLSYHK